MTRDSKVGSPLLEQLAELKEEEQEKRGRKEQGGVVGASGVWRHVV